MEQIHLLIKSQTVTVSGACLALTNILNKVYSERSCLTCVLNNIAPSSLCYSKQKGLLNGTNSTLKYRIPDGSKKGNAIDYMTQLVPICKF